MKKQNWLVLGAAVALIAVVAALAAFMPQNRSLPEDAPALETAAPAAQATAEPQPEEPQPEEPQSAGPPAEAYLVVSVQGNLYEPLPLSGEGAFTIKQDEHTTNTVHVTPDSIWMEHSSCENQDCVDQGTVSLENMKDRVLYNMIICLPNQVVLELHTPESLESVFGVQMVQ